MRNNIIFIQENSLFLTRSKELQDQFDLIWIDGAHGYPIACADIINSVSLANTDTIIMCDDVYKSVRINDSMYRSMASWETIEELKKSCSISCDYFLKRLGIRQKNDNKYIGYITLR
jgi:predicted O-methyltransferase YrrM